MTSIIERCSEAYGPMYLQSSSNTRNRSNLHTSNFGISKSMRELFSDEAASDELVTNDSGPSYRSSAPSSRTYSNDAEGESEMSNISSRLAARSSVKTTATLVGVYGPGGIGICSL